MSVYTYPISVIFEHQIRFTQGVFRPDNLVLAQLLDKKKGGCKAIVFLEQEVSQYWTGLCGDIEAYLKRHCPHLEEKGIHLFPGGEEIKNDLTLLQQALDLLRDSGLDRHSYVFAIGGGAFLDMIGFAASITHRGVRLVRFPTTVLSQDDSGVGVKNGINAYGQKNFLGTFSVPYAVINDLEFIDTQPEEARRAGLIEAIKVALVKDANLFEWIESRIEEILKWDRETVHSLIERSAVLHAEHIALSGDAFEQGSSRPLDFGHWAAHKLERMSGFTLGHAEGVSIGVALDVLYSTLSGLMEIEDAMRILHLLDSLDMPLWSPLLEERDEQGDYIIMEGLQEFQEHLGGELTLLMLKAPGDALDIHEVRQNIVLEAIEFMKMRDKENS